jgi:hypothetical protein
MDDMIGYCGYNCGSCAARSDDPALRQKLVDGWRKIFGHQHYSAQNVTKEEYDLCARQFEGMPNLIKVLIREGKLPPWVGEKLSGNK